MIGPVKIAAKDRYVKQSLPDKVGKFIEKTC